ncbi:MAG: RNA methyltransferase [Clostridia bacterium]|nr:RNA methyltransferase [Clostridia bacterium]
MADFLRITSKDNPIIKEISSLQKSAKGRKDAGLFVLEGLRLCLDAALNEYKPEVVIVTENAYDRYQKEIESNFSGALKKYLMPDSLFSKISDTVSPQGILCLFKIPEFDGSVIKKDGRYIALENIQDPSNLGAVSRTAEALGIDGMIVCGGCDIYSPKSLRASMGALLRIPVIETDDPFELIDGYDFATYAAVVSDADLNVGSFDFSKGSVVFIGNEANGLTNNIIDKCSKKVTIPMAGKAESLNAGVAASIIMWEMCKC